MNTSNKKDNKYQIAVIPGDGIGKEVMEATISVLDELDVDFDYVYGIAGTIQIGRASCRERV